MNDLDHMDESTFYFLKFLIEKKPTSKPKHSYTGDIWKESETKFWVFNGKEWQVFFEARK
jgi:hypothetical protein